MGVDLRDFQHVVAIAQTVDRAELVKRGELQRDYCSEDPGDVDVVGKFDVATAEPRP